MANYNWLYTALALGLLGHQLVRGKPLPLGGRELTRWAWTFAGLYLLVVYPFPTWSEPRYSLVVLAVLLVSLGVLVSLFPYPNTAAGAAIVSVLFLLVSQRTSQDPLTHRYNGYKRTIYYGVELDEWEEFARGQDRFMYNLQLAEVARRQLKLMIPQLVNGAEVLIMKSGAKLCDQMTNLYEWPILAVKYGTLAPRPLCLEDRNLVGQAKQIAGKKVALFVPITGENESEVLKTAKSVTDAYLWTER